MPDLIRISLVFLAILVLLRKKLGLGYVMISASAILAVLYRLDAPGIAFALKKTVFNEVTLKLFFSLSLIRTFEIILREQNLLTTMMSAIKNLFSSRRAVIVSMPLLIGMLPSLGGAYFSAPMVKESTAGTKMKPEEKAFINYWFRHPWELVLPLYPGILLAAAVSGVPLYSLIAANLLCAAMLLSTGFLFSMRRIGANSYSSSAVSRLAGLTRRDVLSFLPVIVVLLLVMGFRMELHYALMAIIIPLLVVFRYRTGEILRVTKYGFAPDVAVMIFGIMLFKEMMDASGSVGGLSRFFIEQGVPMLPVLCLLPFVTGLLTGHTVGFVGSTFPLIINISGGGLSANIPMAFTAGFIGVLLSPVHLCLILTREYFKADLTGMYRRIIPAGLIVFATALAEYLVLQ